MSEKILTVVVPSYNVEAYLEEGLNSLIHPDIMEDMEVLIINDGSITIRGGISPALSRDHEGERRTWFDYQ